MKNHTNPPPNNKLKQNQEQNMDFLTLLFFSLLFSSSCADISEKLGICYGQLGNNLPNPYKSVHLITKTLKAKRVKIYDANPHILNALGGTDLQVSVMVPNQLLVNISSNQSLSHEWVSNNVLPFYPRTKIRYLLVGNEILSVSDDTLRLALVPAMRRIRTSIKEFGLHKIKVSTPLAMDVMGVSFPPSAGSFQPNLSEPVMRPMLQFLNRTKSFFFLDVYPYFAWASDPASIKLDYALMEPTNVTYTDPGSGLTYTNLLDQMIDSVIFAMKGLGYPNIRLFIAETGWPNAGDFDQIGASIYNSATYNRNVVKKFTAKPPLGTPARPGVVIPTFIFALYNENQKPGPSTERHFGLLYPNGSAIYPIDLSGKTPESTYKPLPPSTTDEPYKGKIWCVAIKGANATDLGGALTYACGQGNGTCDPIQPGGKCYKPNLLRWHASYAFSSYWAQFKKAGGSCYFNGVAVQTAKDPSYGSCKFPSVTL